MHRSSRPRHTLLTLGLAALLLAPLPARAVDETSPPTDSTMAGVVFAVVCGASVAIHRLTGGVPIVAAVGAFACFGMVMDALASPDTP